MEENSMLQKSHSVFFFSFFLASCLYSPFAIADTAQTPAAPSSVAESPATSSEGKNFGRYTGNTKSRVFHQQGCRYFNCKSCTISFDSPAEATTKGYTPCKRCITSK